MLVTDLANQTGDEVFDGTLEPPLGVALEGASFISAFSRASAHKIAKQVKPDAPSLDATVGRLIAVREGIGAVVAGRIENQAAGYRITTQLLDPRNGKILAEIVEQADDKDAVLSAIGKLATQLRTALGDATPAPRSADESYTASNLEAAHAYAEAQQANWTGKWELAIVKFQRRSSSIPSSDARTPASRACTAIRAG